MRSIRVRRASRQRDKTRAACFISFVQTAGKEAESLLSLFEQKPDDADYQEGEEDYLKDLEDDGKPKEDVGSPGQGQARWIQMENNH